MKKTIVASLLSLALTGLSPLTMANNESSALDTTPPTTGTKVEVQEVTTPGNALKLIWLYIEKGFLATVYFSEPSCTESYECSFRKLSSYPAMASDSFKAVIIDTIRIAGIVGALKGASLTKSALEAVTSDSWKNALILGFGSVLGATGAVELGDLIESLRHTPEHLKKQKMNHINNEIRFLEGEITQAELEELNTIIPGIAELTEEARDFSLEAQMQE